MNSVFSASITDVFSNGFSVFVACDSMSKLLEEKQCYVVLSDSREISPKQRNKIFALVKDITCYTNGTDKNLTEFNKMLTALQLNYVIDITKQEEVRKVLIRYYCLLNEIDFFSLKNKTSSTVKMDVARDFIDWLIELCVAHGIPCSDTLLNRCEDQTRYLYACVMNRICCICGKPAEIHEYDFVGMGRNRETIHHLGQKVQPLCRKHHNEVGNIGQKAFDEKYHVSWVKLDEAACQRLQWKK